MKEIYTPVILSSEEVDLISLLRSSKDKDTIPTVIELLRQLLLMNGESRFRAIQSIMNIKDDFDRQQKIALAIQYGKRYSKRTAPKAQFGDLKIYITK